MRCAHQRILWEVGQGSPVHPRQASGSITRLQCWLTTRTWGMSPSSRTQGAAEAWEAPRPRPHHLLPHRQLQPRLQRPRQRPHLRRLHHRLQVAHVRHCMVSVEVRTTTVLRAVCLGRRVCFPMTTTHSASLALRPVRRRRRHLPQRLRRHPHRGPIPLRGTTGMSTRRTVSCCLGPSTSPAEARGQRWSPCRMFRLLSGLM
mmetsp:Transcript_12427/g.23430  ORF Transcript_12427/g.23430 Transcript_12427/m.23430 type:complete len:202 (+) Transcript_12427:215-820(+)